MKVDRIAFVENNTLGAREQLLFKKRLILLEDGQNSGRSDPRLAQIAKGIDILSSGCLDRAEEAVIIRSLGASFNWRRSQFTRVEDRPSVGA